MIAMPHSIIEPATVSPLSIAHALHLLTQVVQSATAANREALECASSIPASTVPCGCLAKELCAVSRLAARARTMGQARG
jgi:hypothetical protein